MPRGKSTKRMVKKAVKKGMKKAPALTITIILLIVIIAVALYFLEVKGIIDIPGLEFLKNSPNNADTNNNNKTTTHDNGTKANVDFATDIYDDFQIHFMMLGNDYAGDSIYIKAGDTDVLIDAGSRSGSFNTTSAYIDNYCTDKKLEYVIMTHGDQDHIDAFPKFAEAYEFGTIITNEHTTKTTQTYKKVITAFENEVTEGAKWYYAADCYNNQNGAQRTYELSENVTMTILYNYYYFNQESDDENDYSVLTLFTYKDTDSEHYFFLGGDLEKKGEKKFVEYYDGSTKEKTMPEVDLYKAGHHGSKTSSNVDFLALLKPKMCVVTCCCGTDEYTGITDNQFPTQEFIDRISVWTDEVYCTTVCDSYEIATAGSKENSKGQLVSDKTGVAIGGNYIHSTGFKPMNGNIVVSCATEGIALSCSNNQTKLKDQEWFNETITIDGETRKMRTWPNN